MFIVWRSDIAKQQLLLPGQSVLLGPLDTCKYPGSVSAEMVLSDPIAVSRLDQKKI